MTTTKTFTAGILAIAAAALPLTAAHASDEVSVEVGYADLNLATEKGQQIFDRRIERSIEKVCGRLTNHPTFDGAVRSCQKGTRVNAMRQRNIAVANYGKVQLAGNETRTIRFAAR